MFSLVDEGILQIPKSAWLWQTWTDNFLHLIYMYIHGTWTYTINLTKFTTYNYIVPLFYGVHKNWQSWLMTL